MSEGSGGVMSFRAFRNLSAHRGYKIVTGSPGHADYRRRVLGITGPWRQYGSMSIIEVHVARVIGIIGSRSHGISKESKYPQVWKLKRRSQYQSQEI